VEFEFHSNFIVISADHLRVLTVVRSIGTMLWSDVATIGDRPCARHWQTASLVGNRLFVFAGYDGSNQRNDLYSLNLGAEDASYPCGISYSL
jgi:hypothetical protein